MVDLNKKYLVMFSGKFNELLPLDEIEKNLRSANVSDKIIKEILISKKLTLRKNISFVKALHISKKLELLGLAILIKELGDNDYSKIIYETNFKNKNNLNQDNSKKDSLNKEDFNSLREKFLQDGDVLLKRNPSIHNNTIQDKNGSIIKTIFNKIF